MALRTSAVELDERQRRHRATVSCRKTSSRSSGGSDARIDGQIGGMHAPQMTFELDEVLAPLHLGEQVAPLVLLALGQ